MMSGPGWFTVLGGLLAAVLGILTSIEVDVAEVLLVERGVALPKSRSRVFSFVSDLTNYPEWCPGTKTFEPTDSTPLSVGKHYKEVYYSSILGETVYDNVITGYESPRYISFLSDGFMKYRLELEFEKRPENTRYPTRAVCKLYSRRNSVLFKHFVAPVLGYWMNEIWIRPSMFHLRSAVESERV